MSVSLIENINDFYFTYCGMKTIDKEKKHWITFFLQLKGMAPQEVNSPDTREIIVANIYVIIITIQVIRYA